MKPWLDDDDSADAKMAMFGRVVIILLGLWALCTLFLGQRGA